ncbi:MAG TPA: DUF1460 domain-containing protein [Bacteroidota bacterium]|nr:DUF1460 domain-containing protein [Bacteroidota bacterium]
MNRREFLQCGYLSVIASVLYRANAFSFLSFSDIQQRLCEEKFRYAAKHHLSQKPLPEIVTDIARSFIGTPYVAHTLDLENGERLIIRLDGVDCVTLYEYSLAFARCIKKRTTTYDGFCNEVQFLRYRNGIIDGFASRLHYTSDYFYNNEEKGVLKNITKELGDVPYKKTINFMTMHRELYPALRDDAAFRAIQSVEKEINSRQLFYIPKSKVSSIAQSIHSGDIIAITTTKEGLDCSHTGIALQKNNDLYFIHAPVPGSAVQMTQIPLWKYLQKNSEQSGVMVARPQEVQ